MKVLRTPDDRFTDLPGFGYAPRYAQANGLRIHYLDEGPQDAPPILLLHGEPSWCYLYRHMIAAFKAEGLRAVAPDLPGFGRSDKPAAREDYSYQRLVDWMADWLQAVNLNRITLVCQDWGSLIGLRLAAEHPERFDRVVLANGGLPEGGKLPPAFKLWQGFVRYSPWLPVSKIVQLGTTSKLAPEILAAYEAPFPSSDYKQGVRALPLLVPTGPDDSAITANRKAWSVLREWNKPFLTAFSDKDPITRGGERKFQNQIPGAKNQQHVTIRGGGHFLQEDKGPELAGVVAEFIARTG